MNKIAGTEIVSILSSCEIKGDPSSVLISNVRPIEVADGESLTWIRGTRADRQNAVRHSRSRMIICDDKLEIDEELAKCFVVVPDPKLAFLRVVERFFARKPEWGVHPTAVIHPQAVIHKHTWIGPFSYVGNCEIGEGTVLHGHCFVHDDVVIGKSVILHAHTVVGSDGFGFIWNEEKKVEKFLHVGTTVIEDNVELYPFTNVDRGTLGETRVGAGSKIDHYGHISHNCSVGCDTIITAGTVMCGGSHIGSRTWIGVHSVIKEKVTVGDDALIGLSSVVTKSVPDGETWLGSPARPIEAFRKIQQQLQQLAEKNDEA